MIDVLYSLLLKDVSLYIINVPVP